MAFDLFPLLFDLVLAIDLHFFVLKFEKCFGSFLFYANCV